MSSSNNNNNNISSGNTVSTTNTAGSSSINTSRSWLEGTLGVISGMAPRPSTPVRSSTPIQDRQPAKDSHHRRGLSFSAPSSPLRPSGHSRSVSSGGSGGGVGQLGLSLASGIMRDNIKDGGVSVGTGSGGGGGAPSIPSIRRLPSQDSLDCSIHNDSGHGQKSTAQIIRDLRQSNARLTARTAALEADFMNQLASVQKEHSTEQQHLRERVLKGEKLTQALENRILAANARVKQSEEQLQRVREESAFQRHQISDYRTQLAAATAAAGEEGDAGADGQSIKSDSKNSPVIEQLEKEKQQLIEELGESMRQAANQTQEKIKLQTEVSRLRQTVRSLEQQQQSTTNKASSSASSAASVASTASSSSEMVKEQQQQQQQQGGESSNNNKSPASKMLQDLQWAQAELERTQEALEETQEALDESHAQARRAETAHKKQLVTLREELQQQQSSNDVVNIEKEEKESFSPGDAAKDSSPEQDASKAAEIASLRAKVLEYSHQLTAAQESLNKVKGHAQTQEQYRREEAEDLRVLNDAQEEEIETLRVKLSEANKKVTAAEEQVQQQKAELHNRTDEMAVIEESSQLLNEIQGRLEESQTALQELSDELKETKQSHDDHVSDLSKRITKLTKERSMVQEQLAAALHDQDSVHGSSIQDQVERLTSMMQMHEKEKAVLTDRLRQAQESLSEAHAQTSLENDEIRRQISELEYAKETMESEFQAKLIAKETEILAQQHNHNENTSSSCQPPASGESTADHAREVADLQAQIESLRQELKRANTSHDDDDDDATLNSNKRQSGGSYEDDLRKEVSALKSSESELLQTLTFLREDKETEIAQLKEKLSDRDTTISALVKSSVSLEQQMASAQVEMDLLRAKLANARGRGDFEEGVDVILAKGQDVGRMQSSLDAYRETEARLTNDLYRLKKQLHQAKVETGRLRKQLEEERSFESTNARSMGMTRAGAADADDATQGTTGGGSVSSVTPQQLKERDEAIARLVKQSMTQERKITELKQQLEGAALEIQESRSNAAMSTPPSPPRMSPAAEEVEQLRQETEMFAGQVIEQDEEIEALKTALREQKEQVTKLEKELEEGKGTGKNQSALEERIVALMNEVNDLKSRPMADGKELERIRTLEAEIDELKEANAEQLAELRVLRKSARDGGSAADEIALAKSETAEEQNKTFAAEKAKDEVAQELAQVQAKLEEAQEQVQALELNKHVVKELQEELVERSRRIGELEAAPPPSAEPTLQNKSVDEVELESYKDEVEGLKNNLAGQTAALDTAKKTIRELETMLAEKSEEAMAQFEEEKEELIGTVEDLTNQLNEARDQLTQLEEDKALIDDFKEKLELADEAREESEKSIVETYERKLALLTLNKDVTIDNLRKDLVTEKEESAQEIEQLTERITQLEAESEELKERAMQEIQQREQRIYALEHTLEASKTLVGNMRTEMDHLQGSMVNAAAGRREEIEDMQQELVDLTATAAGQERELSAARIQLEENHLAHQAEVAKLRETIEMLESQAPEISLRNAQDLKMELRVKEVKDRLEKLKFRNTSLQEENTNLRERLNQVENNVEQTNSGTTGSANATARRQEPDDNQIVEKNKTIARLEKRTTIQVEKIAKLQKELETARAVVVTPAPTLPPTTTMPDKKSRKVPSSPLRIGFLRRKSNQASGSGGGGGSSTTALLKSSQASGGGGGGSSMFDEQKE